MSYGQKYDFSSIAGYCNYFRNAVPDYPAFMGTSKRFWLWHMEDFDAGIVNAAPGFHFLLEDPESDFTANGARGYSDKVTGSFVVVCKAKADDVDDEISVSDTCKKLAMAFLSKMIRDKDKQRITSFDPNSAKGMKVGPMWDNYFGYRLEFRVDAAAGGMYINADDFTETAVDQVADYARDNGFLLTTPDSAFQLIQQLRNISA